MKLQSLPILAICLGFTSHASAQKSVPNHAIADLVLGQTDFVTGDFTSPYSSFNMNNPNAVVVDPISRKVFVSDDNGDRVLRYPSVDALQNGSGAEAVLGQQKFSTGGSGATDVEVNNPRGIFLDRFGRLWIADSGNNRVLMFEAAVYRNTGAAADRVYGQPDFLTTTAGNTAALMDGPEGVWLDGNDTLWVADTDNHRVLRFDSITTKFNGASANGVLGQINFTNETSGSGTSKFNDPTGVAVSSNGSLFVSDRDNNRVLRFDGAATLGNGAPASVVLGQPDFGTTTSSSGATRMDSPTGAWITPGDALWVCDRDNNRVIRFAQASSQPSGAAADRVVGQPNFTTNTPNTTNRGLDGPEYHPFVDAAGALWVPDQDNDRVLRFPPDTTKPLLTVKTKVPKNIAKKRKTIRGSASDQYGISRVKYKVNRSKWKTANGKANWKFSAKLKKGKNTIRIIALDSVGNASATKVIKIRRTSSSASQLAMGSGR